MLNKRGFNIGSVRVSGEKNVVYGLRCVCHPGDGVRYVGQTSTGVRQRWYHHKYSANHDKPYPVSRWIRKHGVDNIEIDILEVLDTTDDLDLVEERWISRLGTSNAAEGGLNLLPGGKSIRGYKHPPEVIARRPKRVLSEETLARLSKISSTHTGDRATNKKLSVSAATEIKKRLWAGDTPADIARDYGVSAQSVYDILNDERWLEAPWPIGPRRPIRDTRFRPGIVPKNAKLDASKVRDIRNKHASGISTRDIAMEYGVTTTNVLMIVKRKTWKNVE